LDRNVGLIPRLNSKGEDIMVRDLLLLLAVSIVLSAFIWSISEIRKQGLGIREVKHHFL
jgi:hypothetical protein